METTTPINWFPGHMAKTKRLLSDQIRKVDLVIELCDARLPFFFMNSEIIRMIGSRKHLLFLNKADLADPQATAQWLRILRKGGLEAYPIDSTKLKSKEIIGIIQQSTREATEKSLARGIRKTVRAMVAGVPNVGKSTLINQLHGKNIAQTGDRPGVTKSNQWVRVTPYLEILDTPGLLWPRLDDQEAARRLCYIGSVKDEVTDPYMLTVSLMEELKKQAPEKTAERFHLQSLEHSGAELLEDVCKGRGWLLKGNQYDYERACSVILDEFRGGKIGRITLERPAAAEGEDNG